MSMHPLFNAGIEAGQKACADQISTLQQQNDELRADVRRIGIVQHVRMAEGGGTVPNGWSCKVCRGEWDHDAPENHALTCSARR